MKQSNHDHQLIFLGNRQVESTHGSQAYGFKHQVVSQPTSQVQFGRIFTPFCMRLARLDAFGLRYKGLVP